MKEVAKLIREDRFTEAKHVSMRFTGILGVWELQKENMRLSATKDASANQREEWTKTNHSIC